MCTSAWYQNNKESVKLKNKLRYERTKEVTKAKRRETYQKNKEREKEMARAYKKGRQTQYLGYYKKFRKLNPEDQGAINARTAKRKSAQILRTPKWLTSNDFKEISDLYILARDIAWLNQDGKTFHVDHIIPLQGKTVSGLHVPWNLQLLPGELNAKKWATLTT